MHPKSMPEFHYQDFYTHSSVIDHKFVFKTLENYLSPLKIGPCGPELIWHFGT